MLTDSNTPDNTPTCFGAAGATLAGNGYLITPIAPGKKNPVIKSWPDVRMVEADFEKYKNHGVGIICGKGEYPIAGIDIDSTHAALVKDFTDWICREFGMVPERVGRHPKTLLLFRVKEPGWSKIISKAFTDEQGETHRLEILCDGQQFVAYGIHPATGKPYEWVGISGQTPDNTPASELPVLTREQAAQARLKFQELAAAHGLKPVEGSTGTAGTVKTDEDDPLMDYTPRNDLTLEEARELLQYIDCNLPYDNGWIDVGMVLHFEFHGSEEALDLWDEWSRPGIKYEGRSDLEYHWGTFRHQGGDLKTAIWLRSVVQERREQNALNEIKKLVQDCNNPIDLMDKVASRAGALAHGNPALRATAEGLLSKKGKELTKVKIPINEIRKAMRKGVPVADKEDQGLYTDLTTVDLFIAAYGERVRYVEDAKKSKQWLLYNGNYYDVVSRDVIKGLVADMVRNLPPVPEKILDESGMGEYQAYIRRSQSAYTINGVVGLLTGETRLRVRTEQLDTHRNILCCKNGPVDLHTGETIDPSPEMLLTQTTRTEYDPDAKAPLFEKTIADAFSNDEQNIRCFQLLVGYAVCGNPKHQIMPILEGSGGNGKSTIMNALNHVLGDYAATVDASTFFSKGRSVSSPGSHRADLVRLNKKRLITIGEPDSQCEIRTEQIKSLTGNDKIVARGAYADDALEFEAVCVPFMVTNYPINTNDVDEGTWRRILRILLERNLTKEPGFERDLDLPKKLEAEAAGITALCVKWAKDFLKNGLVIPQKIIEWTRALRREADPIGSFLEQRCVFDVNQSILCKDLHMAYKMYRHDTGDDTTLPSQKWLTSRLKGRDGLRYSENVKDPTSRRGTGRGFFGIGLISQEGDFE